MLINLKEILAGCTELSGTTEFSREQIENSGVVGPVDCGVRVDPVFRGFLLHVLYSTKAEETCARCLKKYEYDLSGNIEFLLKEYGEEIDSEDVIYYKPDDNSVDITEFIYSAIVLGRSMKPLCSEDCKGIEWNNRDDTDIDPRWVKLKELKKDN